MAWLVLFCFHTVLITATLQIDQKPNATPFMGSILKPNDKALREGTENPPVTTTAGSTTKNCVCSKIYDPVCASNNKSYYNLCQMECDNTEKNNTVVHQGNCIPF